MELFSIFNIGRFAMVMFAVVYVCVCVSTWCECMGVYERGSVL